MKLKINHKISLGIITLVIGLISMVMIVGNHIITVAMEKKVRQDLLRAKNVFDYSREILSQDLKRYVRLVATLPDLNQLVSAPSLGHEKALLKVQTIQSKVQSDLFMVTDNQGTLLASVYEPKLFDEDLSKEPIFDKALRGQTIEGYWLREEGVYRVIASPLMNEGQVSGTFLIGFSLEELLNRTMPRMTKAMVALVIGKTLFTSADKGLFNQIGQEIINGELKKNEISLRRFDNERFLTVYVPLGSQNAFILARSLDQELIFYNKLQRALLNTVVLLLILALSAGLYFSAKTTRPIQSLEKGVQDIAKGKFDTPINVYSQDEIGSLAQSVRKMARNLKRFTEEFSNAEKMKTIGQLSASIVHEVKNPLSTIMNGIELLSRRISPKSGDDSQEIMKGMEMAANQANTVIRGLLDLSRMSELDYEKTDINVLMAEILTLVENEFEHKRISIIKEFKQDLAAVLIDKNKIKQVCINILMNALEAMPDGGEIKMSTGLEQVDEEDFVCIVIDDSGPGIPTDKIEKVYEPFYTSRGKTGGTGLGLTIASNIISLHKGSLHLMNREEGGLRVRILLRAVI